MDSATVIQGIRELLASGAQFDRNRLVELAAAYMQACRQTNERVIRCRELLCRAMREQAVEEADAPPELRKEIQTLTFDERSAWLRLCEQVGIDIRPFDLDTELAARVAADVSTDPDALQSLLRTHRLLALGHAPLKQRLIILRHLCRADALHPFWRNDTKAFEIKRQKEIRALAVRALAHSNLVALEGVLRDLRSPEWLNPPPARLGDAIEARMQPMRAAYAEKQYAYLGEQIRDAHGEFDDPGCRDLVRQWHEVAEQTGVGPDPDLAELVAPAEDWLKGIDEEQQQEQRALDRRAALQSALDEGKDWRIIEQRLDNVVRHSLAPPQELVSAAQEQIEKGRAADRRRRVLRIGGIFAGVAVIIAVGAALLQSRRAARVETAYAHALRKYIDQGVAAGNFEAATDLVETIEKHRPELLSSSEPIQALVAELDQKENDERARREAFGQALAAAQQKAEVARGALEGARGAIGDSCDEASAAEAERHLTQLDSVVTEIEPLLAEAAELAKRSEENAGVERVRTASAGLHREAADIRRTIADSRATELARALEDVEAKHDRLEDHLDQAYRSCSDVDAGLAGEFSRAAEECSSRATELAVRPNVQEHALRVSARVDELRAGAAAKKRRVEDVRSAVANIRRLYTNPEGLARALQAFHREHDRRHPLASDFEAAVKLVDGWRAADAWVQLSQNWSTDARVREGKTARSLLQLLDTHLTEYAASPYKDVIGPYQTYLQKAATALPPDDERITGYRETEAILNHRTIAGLYAVRLREIRDAAYYTPDASPNAREAVAGRRYFDIHAISDTEGNLQMKRLFDNEVADPDAREWPVAPQSAFARAGLERLREFDGKGWETFYLELADDVRRRSDVDAILRVSLLKLFLPYAANCLPVRPEADQTINDVVRSLGDVRDNARWYWPLDNQANQERHRARGVLDRLRPLDSIIQDVEKQLDALKAPLQPYRPVGVFLGTQGGLHIDEPLAKGGLYVLEEDGGAFKFQGLGVVPEGKAPEIDTRAARSAPAGSIIYFRSE